MNFTVNGGTLTAKHGPAIYMPGQVNLSITDGVLNGGISLRMGQVSISGGTSMPRRMALILLRNIIIIPVMLGCPTLCMCLAAPIPVKTTTYGNSLHLNITGGTLQLRERSGAAPSPFMILARSSR